ncbi:unnamed protein product [Paramecium sonneborni]|uniref:Uncharacterized protein n=1 Tax=Paramecium sonneborni TaxID=65129 RepID=A0A8S1L1Y9_9CILI|nr:unnamed protein product [Paramecium sonneborni]
MKIQKTFISKNKVKKNIDKESHKNNSKKNLKITLTQNKFQNLNTYEQFESQEQHENSRNSSLDHIKYKYKIFIKRAKEKCRLDNILYEISRIQFIIQQQFGDQVLQQSYQMGGKLSNNYLDHQNSKESNRLTVKPANSLDIENDYALLEPLEMLQKQP